MGRTDDWVTSTHLFLRKPDICWLRIDRLPSSRVLTGIDRWTAKRKETRRSERGHGAFRSWRTAPSKSRRSLSALVTSQRVSPVLVASMQVVLEQELLLNTKQVLDWPRMIRQNDIGWMNGWKLLSNVSFLLRAAPIKNSHTTFIPSQHTASPPARWKWKTLPGQPDKNSRSGYFSRPRHPYPPPIPQIWIGKAGCACASRPLR